MKYHTENSSSGLLICTFIFISGMIIDVQCFSEYSMVLTVNQYSILLEFVASQHKISCNWKVAGLL